MKLTFAITAFLLSVNSALAAATTSYSAMVCTSFAEVGLTNLSSFGCPDRVPITPTRPEGKEKVCQTLYRGGLLNLDHVGCSAEMLFSKRDSESDEHKKHEGGKNAHRNHHHHREASGDEDYSHQDSKDEAEEPKEQNHEACTSVDLCAIAQTGAINFNMFGCTNRNAKRGASNLRRDDPDCRKQSCQVMQTALIGNLNLFGCT
ncbi:hypothetical protein CF326_g6431 [Tilletia indica]|nr:hypothetical protein CF326_g6431 [Tilletia indica]